MPEDQAVLLFQSVRELLINASKHARAPEATVVLQQVDGRVRIDVKDNGVGFDVAAARWPRFRKEPCPQNSGCSVSENA